jgi:hypothetical protein
MIGSIEFENFMQGRQDGENGIPHENGKSEEYDKGYAFGYAGQQCEAHDE